MHKINRFDPTIQSMLLVKCEISGSSYLSKISAECTQNASLRHSYFTR